MTNIGMRSSVGTAAPPFTMGPYSWDQNLTMNSNLTVTGDLAVTGNFSFGDASVDTLTMLGLLYWAGGSAYIPMRIGTKANTASSGLVLVGTQSPATDSTGGVQIFCDDGAATLAAITSPIWARYLLMGNQAAGATATGVYAQLKTAKATSQALSTGSYTALKAFNQAGTAVTLTNGAEYAIINAGMSLEGNIVNTSGRLSGVDININTSTYTITDTAVDTAALHIRKTSASTYGWTTGLKINDAGAVTGIVIGSCTTGLSVTASTKGMSLVSTLTGTGNLDANTITVTDNTTAGAYCRGVAIGVTAAGAKTGSGEVDGMGIDMTYTGNTVYGYNLSLYGAATGNPTLGFVSAISIYQDNLGSAVSGYAAVDIGIAMSDAPSNRYTYFRLRDHSTAIPISVFKCEGAHCATNFLSYLAADGTPDFIVAAGVSSTQDKKIKIDCNGTPYYIPLYVA